MLNWAKKLKDIFHFEQTHPNNQSHTHQQSCPPLIQNSQLSSSQQQKKKLLFKENNQQQLKQKDYDQDSLQYTQNQWDQQTINFQLQDRLLDCLEDQRYVKDYRQTLSMNNKTRKRTTAQNSQSSRITQNQIKQQYDKNQQAQNNPQAQIQNVRIGKQQFINRNRKNRFQKYKFNQNKLNQIQQKEKQKIGQKQQNEDIFDQILLTFNSKQQIFNNQQYLKLKQKRQYLTCNSYINEVFNLQQRQKKPNSIKKQINNSQNNQIDSEQRRMQFQNNLNQQNTIIQQINCKRQIIAQKIQNQEQYDNKFNISFPPINQATIVKKQSNISNISLQIRQLGSNPFINLQMLTQQSHDQNNTLSQTLQKQYNFKSNNKLNTSPDKAKQINKQKLPLNQTKFIQPNYSTLNHTQISLAHSDQRIQQKQQLQNLFQYQFQYKQRQDHSQNNQLLQTHHQDNNQNNDKDQYKILTNIKASPIIKFNYLSAVNNAKSPNYLQSNQNDSSHKHSSEASKEDKHFFVKDQTTKKEKLQTRIQNHPKISFNYIHSKQQVVTSDLSQLSNDKSNTQQIRKLERIQNKQISLGQNQGDLLGNKFKFVCTQPQAEQRIPIFLQRLTRLNSIFFNLHSIFSQQQQSKVVKQLQILLKSTKSALLVIQLLYKKLSLEKNKYRQMLSTIIGRYTSQQNKINPSENLLFQKIQNQILQFLINQQCQIYKIEEIHYIKPHQKFSKRPLIPLNLQTGLKNFNQIIDYYTVSSRIELKTSAGRDRYVRIRQKISLIQRNLKMMSEDLYCYWLFQCNFPNLISSYLHFIKLQKMDFQTQKIDEILTVLFYGKSINSFLPVDLNDHKITQKQGK